MGDFSGRGQCCEGDKVVGEVTSCELAWKRLEGQEEQYRD